MRYPSFVSVLKSVFIAAMVSSAGSASAQTFPIKPVHIVVPYSTGTGADIVARIIAGPLGERLKQPVVIDNKLGAGAIIGVNFLKQAAPDGYTIGVVVSANAVQPYLVKDMPFDLRKDFMPITTLYSGPVVMTVPVSFPAKTLAEFLSYAKANPDKLFFGSVGVGTTSHMAAEMLKQAAGINMTHVPFKGTPEIYAAMLGGNVHVLFDNYATPRPLIEAGKLTLLGVASKERWATLPQAPTIAETFPGFEVLFWTGLAAPIGTPRDAFDRLAVESRVVLNAPDVRKRIADTGVDPGGGSPAEFTQMIASEMDKWSKVVQKAGFKPE